MYSIYYEHEELLENHKELQKRFDLLSEEYNSLMQDFKEIYRKTDYYKLEQWNPRPPKRIVPRHD